MKKIILIVAIFLLTDFNLKSQSFEGFSLGPYLSGKAGVSVVSTPSGRQNGIAFSGIPDFGLTSYTALNREGDLGITFDLGYSTYAFNIIRFSDDQDFKHEFSYFTLAPGFAFNIMRFGFLLGIPLSGKAETEIDTDHLSMIAEFRIGASYPLFADDSGTLSVFLTAGYMLSSIFDDFTENDPMIDLIPENPPYVIHEDNNPRAASVSLGMSYEINVHP